MIWLVSVLVCVVVYLYWKKVYCRVPELPSYIGNLDMSKEKDVNVLISAMHKIASESPSYYLSKDESVVYTWLCTQRLAYKPYSYITPRRKKQFLEFMTLVEQHRNGIKLYNQYMLEGEQTNMFE